MRVDIAGLRCHLAANTDYWLQPDTLNGRPHYAHRGQLMASVEDDGLTIHIHWRSMGAWAIDTEIDDEIAEVCRVRGSRRSCSGCSSAHVQTYSLGRHAIDQSSYTDSHGAAVHNTRASMQIGRLSNASTPATLAPVLWDETCEETWEESVVTVRDGTPQPRQLRRHRGRGAAGSGVRAASLQALRGHRPLSADLRRALAAAAARCAAVVVADEFFGEGGGPVEMPSHQIDGASIFRAQLRSRQSARRRRPWRCRAGVAWSGSRVCRGEAAWRGRPAAGRCRWPGWHARPRGIRIDSAERGWRRSSGRWRMRHCS
jgi:hypothetical protein